MALFIIFISSLVILISLLTGKSKKSLLAALITVFCFPIWVILALAKRYK